MAASPAPRQRRPRRDAQARREAIVTAAAAAFAGDGYGVPLEVIAERAGVGRATLYRNFPDRAALALAIFSREVDRLEGAIDPALPLATTLARMVGQGAAAGALFGRIAADLHRESPNTAAFDALREGLHRIVAPAVAAAHARGEIGAHVGPAEVVLVFRMLGGLALPFMSPDEAAARVDEALALVMAGLRPR